MVTTAVPLHIHAFLSSVLPPFSSFVTLVLSHYQIHTLHLDLSSLVLLSAFAFVCEDFLGVTRSLTLLLYFFSLELRERVHAEADGSLAAATKAREHALSEAQEADCRCRASEGRHRELCTLNVDLEEQAPLRATLGGPPAEFFPAVVGFRASADSLALVEVEQSMEQERLEVREHQVSLAEESLASREKKLQDVIDRGVAETLRSLPLDYRAKLRPQQSRFCDRRGHLKNEVDALRKKMDQEVKRRQVALDTQSTAEGKFSLLYKQVKGAASLVGEAFEEAIHARGLQLECFRMFQSLKRRASRALSDFCGEGVSRPLVPDDVGYLGFFFRVVECPEAGAEKAHALVEEKSHDLLGQAACDVFSHLIRLNPDFDFTAVLGPVPKTICAALAEWVEVHLEEMVTRLAPESCRVSSGDDASS
ncbi:hypothetical protein D1007_21452 [Hordeum vulgare]|nr:hypothetical protein D1007_21452 [Hordeum vulgare]